MAGGGTRTTQSYIIHEWLMIVNDNDLALVLMAPLGEGDFVAASLVPVQ